MRNGCWGYVLSYFHKIKCSVMFAVLGVVQLLNKMDGMPFNENDENFFAVSRNRD